MIIARFARAVTTKYEFRTWSGRPKRGEVRGPRNQSCNTTLKKPGRGRAYILARTKCQIDTWSSVRRCRAYHSISRTGDGGGFSSSGRGSHRRKSFHRKIGDLSLGRNGLIRFRIAHTPIRRGTDTIRRSATPTGEAWRLPRWGAPYRSIRPSFAHHTRVSPKSYRGPYRRSYRSHHRGRLVGGFHALVRQFVPLPPFLDQFLLQQLRHQPLDERLVGVAVLVGPPQRGGQLGQ